MLPLVTLGIYHLVWYYKINREARDLGVTADPGVSLLAITLGCFILIPPFVSIFNTGERIARAQQAAGMAATCSPAVGLVLWIFLFGSGTLYYQSELNKIWDHYGNPPEGSQITIASCQDQAIGIRPHGNAPPAIPRANPEPGWQQEKQVPPRDESED